MPFFLSFLLFGFLSAWGIDLSLPALNSPVMDEAKFLTSQERAELSELAYEIHAHKGPQITILTVPDLQGYPIEEFSIKVAEKWQLGTKKAGDGLLIIVSKAERKIRIEVGEGIEGEITDFESNQFINQVLVPSFKAGNFYSGLRIVMENVAKKFDVNLTHPSKMVKRRPIKVTHGLEGLLPVLFGVLILGHLLLGKKPKARGFFSGVAMAGTGYFMVPGIGFGVLFLFFLGMIFGLAGVNNILYALAASRGGSHRGGGFGGGGFGGGGWSGGGGGFSGGGSSGSW